MIDGGINSAALAGRLPVDVPDLVPVGPEESTSPFKRNAGRRYAVYGAGRSWWSTSLRDGLLRRWMVFLDPELSRKWALNRVGRGVLKWLQLDTLPVRNVALQPALAREVAVNVVEAL